MKLIKSTIFAMMIKALGILSWTGFLLIVSKFLDAEDYGRLEIQLALMNLFAVLSLVGLKSLILKLGPHYLQDGGIGKVFGLVLTGYMICVAASLFLFLIILVFGNIFPQSSIHGFAMTALIFSPLLCITILNMNTLRASGSLVSALSGFFLVRHLIALIIVIVSIQFYELSLYWVYSSIFIGLFILFIWDIFRLTKIIHGSTPSFSVQEWLRASFPYFITELGEFISSKSDIIIVGIVLGLKEVAFYAIAKRASNIILFVKDVVSTVWSPKFSLAYSQQDFTKLKYLASMSWLSVFLPSIGISLLLTFFLGQFLELYLPQMSGALNTALIFVLGHLLISFFGLPGIMLNMFDSSDYFAKLSIGTAFSIVILVLPAAYFGGIEYVAMVVCGLNLFRIISACITCRLKYRILSFGLPFERS